MNIAVGVVGLGPGVRIIQNTSCVEFNRGGKISYLLDSNRVTSGKCLNQIKNKDYRHLGCVFVFVCVYKILSFQFCFCSPGFSTEVLLTFGAS